MGKGFAWAVAAAMISLFAGCASAPKQKTQPSQAKETPAETDEDPEAYSTSDELGLKPATVTAPEIPEADEEKAQGRGEVAMDTRVYLEHVKGDPQAPATIMNFNLHYIPEMYEHWIKYLSVRDIERFSRHMKNGERHFPVVKAVLEKYNVPVELFFVGLIESGFHLGARSHASAVGPWQFIKGTAKRYGLRVDRKVDERHDIVRATEAAASYFRDLYNIFGSWELALCAYNAGEYGVIRAIRKGNTRSYMELARRKLLPKETIYYVPKVAAALEMVLNPEKYGLPRMAINMKAPTSEAAKAIIAEKRPAPPAEKVEMVVYAGAKKVAPKKAVVARVPATLLTHKVKRGEGLYAIADKYGVEWRKIKGLNKLKGNEVMKGQKLRLPLELKRYVVRRGDNLKAIAEKFNTTIPVIVEHNSLKSRTIYPRQRIVVPTAYDL